MTRPLVLFFVFQLLLACGGRATVDGEPSTDADASTSDATDADAPDDGIPGWDHVTSCPDGLGSAMVLLPSGFCIDSTEVTRGQYRAWLETHPSLEGQHERCQAWNDSYEPGTCDVYNPWDCADDDCPQPCVDWCDAFAFCKGTGKRLCGRASGGVIDGWWLANDGPLTDPNVSQWYAACSAGGENVFPYGDAYDKDACNTRERDGGLTPVATMQACRSSVPGYEGVYDLSGNVDEWEDNCIPNTNGSPQGMFADGRDDTCFRRGGNYRRTGNNASCSGFSESHRGGQAEGFRCCYP